MRRAVLLVAGARLGSDVARTLVEWWKSGRAEVLLLQVETPGRLVLVDVDDPAEPRVAGDTDAGDGLVVLNLPRGSEELEAALHGASLLGADRRALAKLIQEQLFPPPAVAEPPPESVDLDEVWLNDMARQAAGEDPPGT